MKSIKIGSFGSFKVNKLRNSKIICFDPFLPLFKKIFDFLLVEAKHFLKGLFHNLRIFNFLNHLCRHVVNVNLMSVLLFPYFLKLIAQYLHLNKIGLFGLCLTKNMTNFMLFLKQTLVKLCNKRRNNDFYITFLLSKFVLLQIVIKIVNFGSERKRRIIHKNQMIFSKNY